MKKNLVIFLLLINFTLSAQNFKISMMCDSRGADNGVNSKILTKLISHLNENSEGIDYLFFPGDMVDGNSKYPEKTKQELLYWKQIMKPIYDNPNFIFPKIWVTVGNHEIQHYKDETNFKSLFQDVYMNGPEDEKGTTYSFDHKNVHFTVINTDRWYYGDPEDTTDDRRDWHYIKHLDWVENDLKSARERGVNKIIVIGHEQPFPTGGHLRDGLPNLGLNLKLPLDSVKLKSIKDRDIFWDILVKYNVSAYLCGHEHLYSRLSYKGVYQIVAGSAGAPIYYHNSLYGDNPEQKRAGQELIYNDAVPYYEVLGYLHGPGKNSQISEDFFGLRAFHYIVLDISEEKIEVKTYGCMVKDGTTKESDEPVRLIDSFVIE